MKNVSSIHRQPELRQPDSRPTDSHVRLRPSRLPSIVLDSQRHIVEIRDHRDDTTRRYVIDVRHDTRNHYIYEVMWKPKWEPTDQRICAGAQFATPDQAVEDALLKIEAWERWLDASRPDNM